MDEFKAIVRRQVHSVEFGFYTDDDVRTRSVVEVTSSQAFDPNNNPLPGGLYDPRMGPLNERDGPCATCAVRKQFCPGHFGHIELAVPVHHPLLVPELLLFLKAKCLACHRLRLPPHRLAMFRAKFHLLHAGKMDQLAELDDKLAVVLAKNSQGSGARAMRNIAQVERETDQVLKPYLPTPPPSQQQTARRRGQQHKMNSYERTLRTALIKACLTESRGCKSCAHCGAFSPAIRQDSSNKFFQGVLGSKQAKVNRNEGIELVPALQQEAETAASQRGGGRASGSSNNNADNNGYQSDDSVERRQRAANVAAETEENDEFFDASNNNKKQPKAAEDDEEEDGKAKSKDKYMHTKEVEAQLKRSWKQDPFLLNCLFGPGGGDNFSTNGYQIFLLQAVPVPPSKFRPVMELNGDSIEHSQNQYLNKIIQLNENIRTLFAKDEEQRAYTAWINLQTTVNCFMDSSKDPSPASINDIAPGIRQILERKSGLFRQNMMGKRVDYACRSVISPDPYVGANEIGLPLYFCTILTYPTPVTTLNSKEMRQLVERGPSNYPGARWVQTDTGKRLDLTKMNSQQRAGVAARLLSNLKRSGRPAIVGRQLRDGDYVLMNRQPTLHKPGIMAHRVRVLHNPTQKTIRMHYANCNTFNADFDGDEMNCHFPQSDIARAESQYIAYADLQYIVPTDGSPLRGLIQDHVVGGVKLTKRDTFLEKWEYQQLLFACLASLPGLEVIRSNAEIELAPPAILKPKQLWTGKQVITTLLRHLQKGSDRDDARMSDFAGISMERKAKTPGTAFGTELEEHLVLIRDSELLRGVLDKSAFGATEFSLVHCVYEAFGAERAGILLSAFSRLFTAYIQYYAGHSCRTEDLILTKQANEQRRRLVQKSYNMGARAAKAWADSEGGKVPIAPIADTPESAEPLKPVEVASASAKIAELLSGKEGKENFAALDGYMQGQLNPLSSQIVKKSLPDGLVVPFPHNTFGIMTTTGAKGSIVNQSQVICALGQQALEGRRVPRMSSGRTLPSFAPYDPNPRADGFVMDRFLTGIRPQEYYFHCMAGREGLVDTAVKTSRSGYLQRCLMKHLEELKVSYDFTVRNAEGGVVQFLYGEDALDPTKAAFLDCSATSLSFLAQNHKSIRRHNRALPSPTIDISNADARRHEAVQQQQGSTWNLLKPGATVRARKIRIGNRWIRGAICRGWFDATVTDVNKRQGTVDLTYLQDGTRASDVPLEIAWDSSYQATATLVEPTAPDPLLSTNSRGHLLGMSGACLSERVAKATHDSMKSSSLVQDQMKDVNLSPQGMGRLIAAKYSASLCAPGEAVGSIAAQSIGEPSTQMTLNTFHLAGSAANVTLGIPRLREIIMSASKTPKTPTMSAPLLSSVDERRSVKLTRTFTKLTLMELLSGDRGVSVTEKLEQGSSGEWNRVYIVKLKLHRAERIREAFGLTLDQIAAVVSQSFVPLLSRLMKQELRRSAADGDVASMQVKGGEKKEFIADEDRDEDAGPKRGRDDLEDDDNDDDDDDNDDTNEADGADGEKQRGRKQRVSYDDDSDDEKPDDENMDEEGGDPAEAVVMDAAAEEAADDDDDLHFGAERKESLHMLKKSNSIVLQPLKVDPAARPLLMVGLVEKAAEKIVIRERKGIDQAFVNEEEGRGRCLQTAGVNFEHFWHLKEVDHNRLLSNDVWAMRNAYGVEAARNTIVQQIRGVFGVYGIEVDPRHLTLIADFMTFEGGFKPMSRYGMSGHSSAFLQMSFETTANFLKQAAMAHDADEMSSPSANICLGRPVRHGTGILEVLSTDIQGGRR